MPILRPIPNKPDTQQGVALMIMLVILVIGSVAILLSALNNSNAQLQRYQNNAAVLAQARDALIGYAVTYADTHSGQVPGYLPCPDFSGGNPEGSAELNCGTKNVSQIGRLPWKTLGLQPLRDSNGECLWYAVAGTYKNNPKTDLMNWDNNGLFQVQAANNQILAGQTPDSRAVAVIFAPGAILGNQNRIADGSAPICGGNYIASNYLDSDASIGANNAVISSSANTISQFFSSGSTPNINDQIIFITRDDIFNALKKRGDFQTRLNNMTQAAATCLSANDLPSPQSSNSNGSGWIPVNNPALSSAQCNTANLWRNWWSNWANHLFYDPTGPDVNGIPNDAVVIFANPKLVGQTRATTAAADYLEGNNPSTFLTGGPGYRTAPTSSVFNDVLYCVQAAPFPAIPCP